MVDAIGPHMSAQWLCALIAKATKPMTLIEPVLMAPLMNEPLLNEPLMTGKWPNKMNLLFNL